jgi:hypothetical protein
MYHFRCGGRRSQQKAKEEVFKTLDHDDDNVVPNTIAPQSHIVDDDNLLTLNLL